MAWWVLLSLSSQKLKQYNHLERIIKGEFKQDSQQEVISLDWVFPFLTGENRGLDCASVWRFYFKKNKKTQAWFRTGRAPNDKAKQTKLKQNEQRLLMILSCQKHTHGCHQCTFFRVSSVHFFSYFEKFTFQNKTTKYSNKAFPDWKNVPSVLMPWHHGLRGEKLPRQRRLVTASLLLKSSLIGVCKRFFLSRVKN